MLAAERAEIVALTDLIIDGADQPLDEYVPGIVHLAECADVAIEDCTIEGSSGSGIALDRCGGPRPRQHHPRPRATPASARSNRPGSRSPTTRSSDCGNAGILVYRWTAGEDGTIVTGNRVQRIAARDGGTGQNGNGINVFRAHGVIVANNRIVDCAFTAIRANSRQQRADHRQQLPRLRRGRHLLGVQL